MTAFVAPPPRLVIPVGPPRWAAGSATWCARAAWAALVLAARGVWSIPRQAWPPLGMVALAGWLLSRAVIAYVADPRPLLAILAPPVVVLGVLAALWIAAAISSQSHLQGVGSAGCAHGAGDKGTEAALWRHERGHARMMRKLGVGVGRQRVWQEPNGAWRGHTEFGNSAKFAALTPAQQIAIYAAGGYAMGSHSHDDGDRRDIEAIRARVPWGQRGQTEREGRNLAKRSV